MSKKWLNANCDETKNSIKVITMQNLIFYINSQLFRQPIVWFTVMSSLFFYLHICIFSIFQVSIQYFASVMILFLATLH